METRSEGRRRGAELERDAPRWRGGREVRVGLFVLIGAAASLWILFLTTDPATFRGRYMVTTTVPEAMGLRKGDPVQMRGVNIGRVHDFGLSRDTEDVVVVLEIEGEWRIPEGSQTQIVTPGLMAPKTVMVIPGTGAGDLRAGANLPGTALKGLMDDTEALGAKGERLLDQMTALLSDSTIARIGGSARGLEEVLEELSGLIGSQREELEGLIGALNRTAEGFADVTGPELRDDIGSTVSQADSLMSRLALTSARVDRAAASLETVLGRMERGEGTLGQLSTNDSLYTGLTETVESVRLLLDDLRENPGRYINLSIF